MPKPNTTVLLADQYKMVQQGIRRILEEEADLEVVGEVDNGPDTVRLTRELKPDLIVMEAHLPGLDSVEVIRRVKVEHPQAGILILTTHNEEPHIIELMRLGAAGYLLKSASSEELVQAIRTVRSGEFVCNGEVMRKVWKHTAKPQPVALDYGQHLTRREAEVLKLAARMSNYEIAAQFGLTERTVKGHLTNIFQKMNVGSRTEAVLEALKRGWISLEDE